MRPQPTESDLASVSSMLDLHEESGLAAIRACGLYHQFLPLTAECDAAHLMSPWAGEGANVSMWDSLDIAAVIADTWEVALARGNVDDSSSARAWREELDPKLALFEKAMQERAAAHAQESHDNGNMIFSNNTLDKLVAFFKDFGAPEQRAAPLEPRGPGVVARGPAFGILRSGDPPHHQDSGLIGNVLM